VGISTPARRYARSSGYNVLRDEARGVVRADRVGLAIVDVE